MIMKKGKKFALPCTVVIIGPSIDVNVYKMFKL